MKRTEIIETEDDRREENERMINIIVENFRDLDDATIKKLFMKHLFADGVLHIYATILELKLTRARIDNYMTGTVQIIENAKLIEEGKCDVEIE